MLVEVENIAVVVAQETGHGRHDSLPVGTGDQENRGSFSGHAPILGDRKEIHPFSFSPLRPILET